MKRFELIPTNGRKSFYHKAIVEIDDAGNETLISYTSPIIRKNTDGSFTRLFSNKLSRTTCSHIISFCGLHKSEFEKLPVES